MKTKVQLLNTMLLPMDRTGVIDLAPMVRALFSYYLPELADVSLRDDDQATAAEIKDEQNNWSLMDAGVEPPMAENGQNFTLRYQWLEQQVGTPGGQKRLGEKPDTAELVQKRLQHLKFMSEQFTLNAQAGRVGVRPTG
jgi:hypothetical protein